MKQLLVFSAFALLFASCASVDNFREPIEDLTVEWENTTTMVSDFVNALQSTQQQLQNQFAEMMVPEGLTLDEESTDKVNALKEDYQEELASVSELSQDVSIFISGWQEKAEKLAGLEDGLDAGELGSETTATIEELQVSVSEAKSSLDSWQGELEDIQTNTSDQLEEFKTLIAKLQGT